MAIDVTTYLRQLDNKEGKLGRWETEIFQLFHARASYQDIADYLQLNDTRASKMEVYRFVHRQKRHHLFHADLSTQARSENMHANAKRVSEINVAKPPMPPQSRPQEDAGMPKFSWRQSRENDKPEW